MKNRFLRTETSCLDVMVNRCVFLLLLTFLLAGCFGTGGDVNQWTDLKDLKESSGRVRRVTDGDTISMYAAIRCLVGGKVKYLTRVRYIGIDTPEKNEPFYHTARELNKRLVYGKRVKLVFDEGKIDRYGRLLAYVYVDDIFVNAEMVRRGYARAFKVPPNTRYAQLFESLEELAKEEQAKKQKIGIWSIPVPEIAEKKPKQIKRKYRLVASKSSEVFHVLSCSWVEKITNVKEYFYTYKEAEESGRRACKVCRPRKK